MNFELNIDEFTIIQNALHYYKKVEKQGLFAKYDDKACNDLRDKLSEQLLHGIKDYGH